MTLVQPTLSLWDEPPVPFRERVVADANDRVGWLRARARGVTATDAAQLASSQSVAALAMTKLLGTNFGGNAFTQHGRDREPAIAKWAHSVYGMNANTLLFHADGAREHLATPDGWREKGEALELCEIKTTTSVWKAIPRAYLRQVWWQQYVLGAERTLVVWERHDNFVPVHADPECRWVDRDDNEIHRLRVLADELMHAMRRGRPTRPSV